MSEKTASTVASLLERGRQFLQEEQFRAADLYFNRVLDTEPSNHEAQWGLLLCAYQCRDTAELYTANAVPFDTNTYYHRALEHADEKTSTYYRAVLNATLLACHARVLKHYEEENAFLLKEWLNHYRQSDAKNASLEALHTLTDKQGKPVRLSDPKTAATMLALDAFYDTVGELPHEGETLIGKLRARVKRLYAASMQAELDRLTSLHPAPSEALDRWADPLSDELPAARIGLDGNGETACTRYQTLAAALEKTAYKTAEDCNAILYCYEQSAARAASDSERQIAEAAKAAFADRLVSAQDVHIDVLLFFIDKFPENGDYCRRYVTLKSVDFTKNLLSYPSDKALTDFLSKQRDDYTDEMAAAMAKKQLDRIAEIEKEYNEHVADLSAYAERAKALLANAEEFTRDWAAYLARLQKQHADAVATLRERHQQVIQKQQTDNKVGSSGALSKGIFATIASYLAVCLSIPLLLCGIYTMNNPSVLLRYPFITALLIALAACGVVHLIKRAVTKPLKRYRPKKYSLPKVCTMLLSLAHVLSALLSVAAAAVFVYSFVTFPDNIGAIPITCVEDFVYIKRAPHANFILTQDIALEDGNAIELGAFYGTLNGDGHSVINLAIDEYAIKANHGTIENLTLHAPVFTDDGAVIHRNRGTLRNVTVAKPSLGEEISFDGLAHINRGRMEFCAVTSAVGECSSFVGFAEKNYGEILACAVTDANLTVDADFAGIAGVNEKTLGGCSFSGTVNAGSAYGLTRVLRTDKATVDQCYTSGNLTATLRLSGLIGSVRDACVVQNSYSTAKLTLKPNDPYNSYAVGLIGGIDDIKEEKSATVRHCYFGGSVITKSGQNGNHYGFVGAMIGDTDPYSHSDYQKEYYLEFDGCFAVASYSFGVKRSADSEGYMPIKIDTSYFTSVHDLSDVLITTTEPTIVNKARVLNAQFLTETVGWDPAIWNLQNGKLPTLKPYVIPVEETPEMDSSIPEEVSK